MIPSSIIDPPFPNVTMVVPPLITTRAPPPLPETVSGNQDPVGNVGISSPDEYVVPSDGSSSGNWLASGGSLGTPETM